MWNSSYVKKNGYLDAREVSEAADADLFEDFLPREERIRSTNALHDVVATCVCLARS